MVAPEHQARRIAAVPCSILTVSDTRTAETDGSGALIRERLESAGHRVIAYAIVPDDPGEVRGRVLAHCDDLGCRAVLVTGGTGLAPRDTTYEALASLFEKRIEGFGELFRMLSYEDIGAAAMLSRAVAGVRGGTVIFSMPGSVAAVRLAMDKLIIPTLGHIAALLGEGGQGSDSTRGSDSSGR